MITKILFDFESEHEDDVAASDDDPASADLGTADPEAVDLDTSDSESSGVVSSLHCCFHGYDSETLILVV